MLTNELYSLCHALFELQGDKLIRKKYLSSNAKIGDVAGWLDCSGKDHYYKVRVDRKIYLLHRLIYLMVNGNLPEVVDHIDGNTLNNEVENLRAADKSKNRWNCLGNKDTESGIKGVYLDRGRWKALVNFKGQRYYLGMFNTKEEAGEASTNKYKELQGSFAIQNRPKGEIIDSKN